MVDGVQRLATDLCAAGRFDAMICLGGAEGSVLGAAAAKALPIGMPKIIVSPIASGQRRFGMFMGTRDVLVMHSIIDILGINPISTTVFDNAAAAIWGMLQHGHRLDLRQGHAGADRKSTRLNASHVEISDAVFCLKKKKKNREQDRGGQVKKNEEQQSDETQNE